MAYIDSRCVTLKLCTASARHASFMRNKKCLSVMHVVLDAKQIYVIVQQLGCQAEYFESLHVQCGHSHSLAATFGR